MPSLAWGRAWFSGAFQITDASQGMPADRRQILGGLAALLILLTGSSGGAAQNWAKKMFDDTSHNFGVVATGAKVEHRFPFTNIYEEDVCVASIKSSCGCSVAKATKQMVKKFETAEIVVSLNTRSFSKRKDATTTVEFQFEKPTDQGRLKSPNVEVRLQTYSYIRQDVVLTPGSVQFGSVREGAASRKEVNLSYAGTDTWQITEIECENPHLEAQWTETGRGSGLVKYLIQVDLKGDAPAAYIREHITLVTNDDNPNAKRVLIAVEGIVEPTVSVNPSPLLFGTVEPDKPVIKNIVITANDPFKVIAATSPDERFQFVVPKKSSKTQLVRAVFTPDARRGPFDGKITIQTDIPNHETLDHAVNGRVGSAEQDTSKEAPPESVSAEEPNKEDSQ
jgi:uncharacterized protein DUF1573